MSGRGDNNQRGSAGRGASNQSNQPFIPDNRNEPASDHRRPQSRRKTYNLSVDEVPYIVVAEPFSYNGEERYYISVNGGPDHVFTWDSELRRLRAIDDEAATLPDALEESISGRLQSGR